MTEVETSAPVVRKSFSTRVPRHQIAWDATSLSALKRCPRYYQYNILSGYTTRKESVDLRFGIEYNDALAHYDKHRAAGATHDDATMAALSFALARTWDEKLQRPWNSEDTNKNRGTLLRSIAWYLDRFADDPCQTIVLQSGNAAAELSFHFALEQKSYITNEQYLLCGYLDRLVTFESSTWILDKKTTRHTLDQDYFAKYTPDTQISQYSFAGTLICSAPIAGVIIDAAQVAVGFTRFQRGLITRTPEQLAEWLEDTVITIRHNERYVDEGYWPMNDAVCGMYGGCPYRPVCSASPDIRSRLLSGLYRQRLWDPLQIREL